MAITKPRLRFLLLAALFLVVLPLSAPAAAPDLYQKARVIARTEIWKEINAGTACSATVAIMDNGKIVYAEGFGMADREKSIPVDHNTWFNIGSVSKVYTAAAIMLLVDEGKVKLDEPVTSYLQGFVMADPRYKDITVRMLLNHTSGLPGTTAANNFGYAYNPEFFEQTLTNLSSSHLKHPPGAMCPYTNDGFTLAEMIVERVSGHRFIDFLSENIFVPLSLSNTGPSIGEQPGKPAAAYYQPDTGKKEPPEVVTLLGAGGLGATAEDLCRFEDTFSGQGVQIFSPAALAELKRAQPPASKLKLKHPEVSFGLGWDMTDLPTYQAQGIQILGKSGGTGRYTSMMFTAPDHRVSVAVIETAANGKAVEIALAVLKSVLVEKGLLEDKPEPVARPLTHQPIPAQYAAFAGYYAPLMRVSFDFKKNLARLSMLGNDKSVQTTALFYHDGYFYDEAGHQSYFTSTQGQDYYVTVMTELNVDKIAAQKLKPLSRPLALATDINGKLWLLRSVKWFEGIFWLNSHMAISRSFADLPGYVDFGGIKRIISPDFAGMPVSNIRDQSELTLIKKDGTTWARVSENLFSPASTAVAYKGGATTVTIGPAGYGEWLKTGTGLILNFEQPAQSRVIVFSAESSPLYDSILDQGAVFAPQGSYIEFAGNPGAVLKITGN